MIPPCLLAFSCFILFLCFIHRPSRKLDQHPLRFRVLGHSSRLCIAASVLYSSHSCLLNRLLSLFLTLSFYYISLLLLHCGVSSSCLIAAILLYVRRVHTSIIEKSTYRRVRASVWNNNLGMCMMWWRDGKELRRLTTVRLTLGNRTACPPL